MRLVVRSVLGYVFDCHILQRIAFNKSTYDWW